MKQIILSSCMGFVTVKMIELHIIFPVLNRKPFSCEVCMAGWFCLLLTILNNIYSAPYVNWFFIPGYMAASMIGAAIINGLMKRI